jgi:hypothetical protein
MIPATAPHLLNKFVNTENSTNKPAKPNGIWGLGCTKKKKKNHRNKSARQNPLLHPVKSITPISQVRVQYPSHLPILGLLFLALSPLAPLFRGLGLAGPRRADIRRCFAARGRPLETLGINLTHAVRFFVGKVFFGKIYQDFTTF